MRREGSVNVWGVLVAAVTLAGGAGRAEARLVALHPPVVTDAMAGESRDVELAVADLLDRARVERVSASKVTKFLAAQPGGRCTADSDACLVELARQAEAGYALFVNVTLYPVTVSGRLVGADGSVSWSPELVRPTLNAREARMDGVRGGLRTLFASLPPLHGPAPAVASADEFEPVPLPPASGGAGGAGLSAPPLTPVEGVERAQDAGGAGGLKLKVAPVVLSGAGALAIVGGVVFHLAAGDTARRFNETELGSGVDASTYETLRQLQSRHSGQRAAGTLLLAGGGAALLGGVVWTWLDHRSASGGSGARVTSVGARGDGIAVAGVWP